MSGFAVEKVRFSQSVTAEVRAAIEPHLVAWAFLIPGWCHEIAVIWNDSETDGALQITVHYEYRRADLEVLANFLSHPEHRARNVVHELQHLSVAPLAMVAKALCDTLAKKAPDVEEWASEQVRQGEEAAVCDLTALVLERLA